MTIGENSIGKLKIKLKESSRKESKKTKIEIGERIFEN